MDSKGFRGLQLRSCNLVMTLFQYLSADDEDEIWADISPLSSEFVIVALENAAQPGTIRGPIARSIQCHWLHSIHHSQ
jgi:hypothetical protein